MSMARFVLVHGAHGGAWCWEPVVGPLADAGHTVEAFDLPGSGDDRTPAARSSRRVPSRRCSSATAWAAW
jgi:alpha-beta hydrolase superfamily lysophospholipase